jgi:hypothetical protein
MKILFSLLLVVTIAGCTTTEVRTPKSTWRVLTKDAVSNMGMQKSNYVPSGTELIFTTAKTFSEKDNQLNINISAEKRCNLSTNLDKQKEVQLAANTVLTVVGYRGETSELVLSEPSYQQYFISCVTKGNFLNRKTSSVKKPKPAASLPEWKKSVVELTDIENMSPLLKVKFIPQ